jgi:cell division initiation protein
MAISPVEIRHLHVGRGVLGYRRGAVDRLFLEIADSFEEVWRQRADLLDRVEHLETEIERHRELETLLRSTLVTAERAAQDQVEAARRRAEAIVDEAHADGRTIMRKARLERERLEGEARRIESLLRSALAVVDQNDAGKEAPRLAG